MAGFNDKKAFDFFSFFFFYYHLGWLAELHRPLLLLVGNTERNKSSRVMVYAGGSQIDNTILAACSYLYKNIGVQAEHGNPEGKSCVLLWLYTVLKSHPQQNVQVPMNSKSLKTRSAEIKC